MTTNRVDGLALVVDDDPIFRRMAAACLAARGLSTIEAVDGHDALARLDAQRPHLILLDVEMPGIDGLATCREIRSRVGDRVAIMIMTGHAATETIDRAFDAGASDFVQKPIDWNLLQHRVRFLMRAHVAFSDLRANQERLSNAQRLARIGHWEWDPSEDEMMWSDETQRIIDRTPKPGEIRRADLLQAVHEDDRDLVAEALRQAAEDGRAYSLDHRVVTRSGDLRVVHQRAEAIVGRAGEVELVSGTIQDISEKNRAQKQIRQLAYYDGLTSLPNRRLLFERLDAAIANAQRLNSLVAVLHADADRFKRINDTLGHAVGDELLQALAQRLLATIRKGDWVARPAEFDPADEEESGLSVARVGGDEFTIVLEHLQAGSDAGTVARRVLEDLREPFVVGDHSLAMSVSIGVATYPNDGETPDRLFQNAGRATTEAKRGGGATYSFYSAEMNQRAHRKLDIEVALAPALERGDIVVYYQPKWEATTGRIVGAEGLSRWPECPLGRVSPAEFVSVAEDVGLMGALGRGTIGDVGRQIREWSAAGVEPLPISINLSGRQLREPDCATQLAQVIEASGAPPTLMEFEITETALLAADPHTRSVLTGLKDLGASLALDDFGTGYSSLSHLASWPIDVVKIDISFVRNLDDPQSRAIVSAVIAMARRLSIITVAEGVETEEQEAYLRAEGCDLMQGYLLSPAVAPDAFAALVQGHRADGPLREQEDA